MKQEYKKYMSSYRRIIKTNIKRLIELSREFIIPDESAARQELLKRDLKEFNDSFKTKVNLTTFVNLFNVET